MRVGFGFDAHRFVAGRPLVLGGVNIAFRMGLGGHSDADVLVHALIDAMLGSIAAGDIGAHFPDTDLKYKNISSLKLLTETAKVVSSAGFELINIDVTAILEEPKLSFYIGEMRGNLAGAIGIDVSLVSVKATTTEGLGFTGRGEGVAAQAVVLVKSSKE